MKPVLILVFYLFAGMTVFARDIRIDAQSQSLDEVLRQLPVSISFDAAATAVFRVTVHKTYPDIPAALHDLLRDKPFRWEKVGDVYIIRAESDKPLRLPLKIWLFDKQTLLPLPYSSGTSSGKMAIADEKGVLMIRTDNDGGLFVHCSSLGYVAVDTLLAAGTHRIYLKPTPLTLGTVTVQTSPDAIFMQTGRKAGEINLNQRIAPFMAGSRDNSVFTMLRMMPGVRASGEALDELMVWGSTGGESAVYFDGIHLFGMRSFNSQISYVNPYLVSGIQLQKQSNDAENGGQTGAAARLIASDGNPEKPEFKLTLNNTTANLYGSAPLGKRIVLAAAYRKSLFDFLLASPIKQPSQSSNNYYVQPSYNFSDANIRLSGQLSAHDKFSFSLYKASDSFTYRFTDPSYPFTGTEYTGQWGLSASYSRLWRGGATSRIYGTFSRQNSNDETNFADAWNVSMDNSIAETKAGITHTMLIGSHHQLTAGLQTTRYKVTLNEKESVAQIHSVFASDRFSTGKLMIETGLRTDYDPDVLSGKRWYVQPRINASYRLFPSLNLTASHNVLTQYVARQAVLGVKDSISLAWVMRASKPLNAEISTFGISAICHEWQVATEVFQKQLHNAHRLYYQQITTNDMTFYGLDFSLRKNSGNNKIFGSYSVMNQLQGIRELSHEIKGGTLLQWRQFYFSVNYVAGWGLFPQTIGAQSVGAQAQTKQTGDTDNYQRIDAGLTYRYWFRWGELSTGVSLLNVLNNANTRYNYYLDTSSSPVNISTGATPFTALLFVELKF